APGKGQPSCDRLPRRRLCVGTSRQVSQLAFCRIAMQTEPMFRTIDLTRGRIDKKARTVELSFSSEMPVDRGSYDEVLSHSPGDVDLSRLADGHPLLLNHDPGIQLGIVDDVWIDGKKGRARVRFSKSAQAEEILQDVADGIRRHVSVGYERL